MRIKFNLDRYAFISMQIEGKVLDVGCQDASGWAHGHRMIGKPYDYLNSVPDITYFDMDEWSHPNFIRGDAHHMPFKADSFDTVVSGDVLEHVPDPVRFISELIRVAKNKIVITTPDEYEWHKDLMPFKDLKNYANSLGMTIDELAKRDTLTAQTQYAKCTDFVKESKMQHLYHIRQFTPYSFTELILEVSKKIIFESGNLTNPIASFEINHFYHPLAPQKPEDAPDMAYWSCVFYKEVT